jgi:hypothetical protein
MYAFDLNGLDELRFCDRLPIVRKANPDEWFYGRGKPKKVAYCPDCGEPLLVFPQDGRLGLWCIDCLWLWLTSKRESWYERSHETLVKEIISPNLIVEVQAAREAA